MYKRKDLAHCGGKAWWEKAAGYIACALGKQREDEGWYLACATTCALYSV